MINTCIDAVDSLNLRRANRFNLFNRIFSGISRFAGNYRTFARRAEIFLIGILETLTRTFAAAFVVSFTIC